jgi:hypothetical protein
LEKKASCRLLSGAVGEKSSLSSASGWRTKQPVVFFPVQLEKKSKQKQPDVVFNCDPCKCRGVVVGKAKDPFLQNNNFCLVLLRTIFCSVSNIFCVPPDFRYFSLMAGERLLFAIFFF